MSVPRYQAEQDQTVQLAIRFESGADRTPYDPSAIAKVEILDANDVLITTKTGADIVNDAIGIYHVDWAIPAAEVLGKHYDKWYYTPSAGHSDLEAKLEFIVYQSGTWSVTDYYLSVADARADCLDANTSLTDAQIQTLIILAMGIIDRCTEQHFLPYAATRDYDGSGKYFLEMDEPIQTIASITNLDNANQTFTPSDFRIKGTWLIHKDYVEGANLPAHLQCGITNGAIFTKGHKNIRVEGTWGLYEYLEPLIKQATCLLVGFGGQWDTTTGPMISPMMGESVEGYGYTLRKVYEHAAIHKETGYPEVDTILSNFRRMQFGSKVL